MLSASVSVKELQCDPKSNREMDLEVYNAAVSGDFDILMRQNSNRRIEDEKTQNNNTVLHLASQFGHSECVQAILAAYPSLLYRVNSRNETALHLAAQNDHPNICLALIKCSKKEENYYQLSVDELETDIERPVVNSADALYLPGMSFYRFCIKVMNYMTRKLGTRAVGSMKEMLLVQGRNKEGNTALHEASQCNFIEVVKVLTRQDPDQLHLPNRVGETPLYMAAIRGYSLLVNEILLNCSSPAHSGPNGATALHGAVISNNLECVRKLLEWNPCLVKQTDENGHTPVHYCALMGYADMVKELLLIDPSAASIIEDCKNTTLHLASSRGHISVMKEIIFQCPDSWDTVNAKQRNVLHIAVEKCQRSTAEFIIDHCPVINCLINQRDVDGNTPLHLVAASGCLIPKLVNHFMANMLVLNYKKLTPLDLLASTNHPPEAGMQIASEFKRAGATLSIKNSIRKDEDGDKENMKSRSMPSDNPDQKIAYLRKMADTHTIVAALVATVTFAACFTIPGGYNGKEGPDQGLATLRKSRVFGAFMVADTIALTFSILAISIYFTAASRETARSNLKSMYKLAGMFNQLSIIAMLIAFLMGTYVTLAPSAVAIATCVVGSILSFVAAMFLVTIREEMTTKMGLSSEEVNEISKHRILRRTWKR